MGKRVGVMARVIPEPVRAVDGKFVISVLLQPDDSPEGMLGAQVNLDAWPSEIFSRLRMEETTIGIAANTLAEPLPANVRDWIPRPRPANESARDALWIKAIGADVLAAAARSGQGTFVLGTEAVMADMADASRVVPKVFHSPILDLAATATAVTATAVVRQLGVQMIDRDELLDGDANPLAPLTQQSLKVFDVFQGTRPLPGGGSSQVAEVLGVETADSDTTVDILKRLEEYGRIVPDAPNRIDPIFPSAPPDVDRPETRADRVARDLATVTKPFSRIPQALQEKIAERVANSTPRVTEDGRQLSFVTELESSTSEELYFQAAAAAFMGIDQSDTRIRLSEGVPQRVTANYADYLLAMQPDAPAKARTAMQTAEAQANAAQTAMHVISGIYSYPQIAAFFGLIVDVEIDADALPDDTTLIAAEIRVNGSPVNAEVWTAVSVVGGGDNRRIEVRPRHPGGPVAQSSEGLLEMGAAKIGRKRRFEIASLDVQAAIDGMLNAARNDYQAMLDGTQRRDLASGLPPQKGAGLTIVDRAKIIEVAHEMTESREPLPEDGAFPKRVLYLEDLSVGYRIDVSTYYKSNNIPWLSLMDRDVTFRDIDAALEADGLDPAVMSRQPDWGVDRLGGSIRSVFREVQSDSKQPLVVAFDPLTSWNGWSLAVPMVGEKVKIKAGEIQLPRRIAPRAGSLPALRYRSFVRFGARCTLANGSSLALSTAVALYNRDRSPYVLREGAAYAYHAAGNGFPVLRHEPLATPTVHHRARDVTGQKTDEPNRQIVVSLDGHGTRETGQRVVLPGPATLDQAELHGVLDKFATLPTPPYADLDIVPKPGTALKDPLAFEDKDAPRVGSYPDPGIRFFSLAFTDETKPAEKFGYAPPVTVDLYPGDRVWPDAAAVALEVVAVPDGTLPLHGRIAGNFDLDNAAPGKTGMARLRTNLAPSEQVDLTIWSLPEYLSDYAWHAPMAASAVLTSFQWFNSLGLIPAEADAPSLQGALGQLSSLQEPAPRKMDKVDEDHEALDVLLRALRKLPIPALSSYQTIRLVHAVEKPLEAPVLEHLFVMHNASVDPSTGGDGEKKIRDAWAAALNQWNLDALERPGDAAALRLFNEARANFTQGSNRIFIGGSVSFHRKSTGRIEIVGTWLDYHEATPRFDRESCKYTFKPKLIREKILDIRKGLAYRAKQDGADRIGLARDETGAPTFLGYTFGDTQARKVQIAARAVSRFDEHFDAVPNDSGQFVRDSEWIEEIVLSSERPKPLEAPFCEPSLHYALDAYVPVPDAEPSLVSGQRHTRTVRLRYDLGDRFYLTGFDERIGVVCWPPHLFDRPEIPEVYEKTVNQIDKCILNSIVTDNGGELPKGAADYISRWGRDPISDSGALPALIPASAFRNAVKSAKTIMPLPAAKKPGAPDTGLAPPTLSNATIEVSLALYDPIFDPDTGRFYVDIEIDQNESYEPWVRLGLARYQEHSIGTLHCSLPVKSMVRIPADRQLEVEIDETRRISLRYSGIGHGAKKKPRGIADRPEVAWLARPILDVTVLRTSSPSFSGAPAVIEADAMTGLAHVSGLLPRVDDGVLEWVLGRFVNGAPSQDPAQRELVLPTDCDLDDISILVTEREYFAADDYRRSFASSRSTGSDFEEPLAWNDTIQVADVHGTVMTSRTISAVHLRLINSRPPEVGK